MVEILKDIQQKYTPVDDQGDKVVLQLIADRARKSQSVRVNLKSPTDALRGLAPFSAIGMLRVKYVHDI